MQEKIDVIIYGGDGSGSNGYKATAREIRDIFKIAENMPESWTDLDVDRFMAQLDINLNRRQGGFYDKTANK